VSTVILSIMPLQDSRDPGEDVRSARGPATIDALATMWERDRAGAETCEREVTVMPERLKISGLLEEVSETHHRVYRISDGTDEDWASWYADWLLDHSELPQLLGTRPVRSHLVHALVQLDRDHTAAGTDEPWPVFYERGLRDRF
jgi:hypothetical protein